MNYETVERIDRAISILVYAILSWKFSISILYEDPLKNIFTTIFLVIFCEIIEKIIFKIAYSATGILSYTWEDPLTKSVTHWKIRAILFILVFVLKILGFWNLILPPIIDFLYLHLETFVKKNWDNFIDNFLKSAGVR